MRPLVLAISGGSGAPYAVRLLHVLLGAGRDVHLVISPAAKLVIAQELGVQVDLERFDPAPLLADPNAAPADSPLRRLLGGEGVGAAPSGRLVYHHYQDFLAPIASGSFLAGGMVVCPCSGSTASAIARGASDNLIHRAADVQLKERRALVLVPREAPLSTIQLENLQRCSAAGAVVLPAMPGYYHGPTSIRDLVDFVVARVCDHLGVEHRLMRRWGS